MKMSFTYSIVMMRRCVKEKLPNLLLEVIHILLDKVLAQPRFHMKSKRVEYSADNLNSSLWFSGEILVSNCLEDPTLFLLVAFLVTHF